MKNVMIFLLVVLMSCSIATASSTTRERTMILEGDIYIHSIIGSEDTKVATYISGTGAYESTESGVSNSEMDYSINAVFSTGENLKFSDKKLEVINSIKSPFGIYANRMIPEDGESGRLAIAIIREDGSFTIEKSSALSWGTHWMYIALTNPETAEFISDDIKLHGRTLIIDYIKIVETIEEAEGVE
jgi:hypothetical protein